MRLCQSGNGDVRKPPVPNGPTVEVLFGGTDGGPDVGVVRLVVPAGAEMAEHDHGGSDIVLLPQVGAVEISTAEETIAVGVGDAALVLKDERVALRNTGNGDAQVIVAAGPAAFVASIRNWPAPAMEG